MFVTACSRPRARFSPSKFATRTNNYSRNGYQNFSSFTPKSPTHSQSTSQVGWIWVSAAVGLSAFAFFSTSSSQNESKEAKEVREAVVAEVDELKDGQMKEAAVGDIKILLARVDGKYYATDLKCTHYGAPLNTGTLSGEHVFCPWHLAKFNVKTGHIEQSPGLDDLNSYPVRIEGKKVIVSIPPNVKIPTNRAAGCNKCTDQRTFVVLGNGAAGTTAAETLRADGFRGKIIMISQESSDPYDRPVLSKAVGVPLQKIILRNEEFYKQIGVEVLKNKEVVRVDPNNKKLSFKDGSALQYDTLLLATGSSARKLRIPGSDLKNVFTLREPSDSDAINNALNQGAQKVVIIGAGFIGMEVAAFLKKNKNLPQVVVVDVAKFPYERILGDKVGQAFQDWFTENGVEFKMSRQLVEFKGKEKVEKVMLANGEAVDADLVVVGVGAAPRTSYLEGTTIPLKRDGGISTDSHLKVADGLYAAGDIAYFPFKGKDIRVEHWAVAQQQGRVAAHNMLGLNVPYDVVPIFWSNAFGSGFKYVGYADKFDDVIIDGDLKKRQFLAYYSDAGKIKAVAAMGKNVVPAMELLKMDKMPPASELKNGADVEALWRKLEKQT